MTPFDQRCEATTHTLQGYTYGYREAMWRGAHGYWLRAARSVPPIIVAQIPVSTQKFGHWVAYGYVMPCSRYCFSRRRPS
jgi:hypothetical protein